MFGFRKRSEPTQTTLQVGAQAQARAQARAGGYADGRAPEVKASAAGGVIWRCHRLGWSRPRCLEPA